MKKVLALRADALELPSEDREALKNLITTYRNRDEHEQSYLKGIPATDENYQLIQLLRKYVAREVYNESGEKFSVALRLKGRGPNYPQTTSYHSGKKIFTDHTLKSATTWTLYIHNDYIGHVA